jgi:predicted DNA-binding transcriptional regulator YafY
MMGKCRAANREAHITSAVDALNRNAAPEEVSKLITAAGRGSAIEFTYTKADGTVTYRQVVIQGFTGNLLRAREHEAGEVKSFRIDRISNARVL